MISRSVFIVFVTFLLARSAFAASFDCASAYTRLEQTICANPLLSSIDLEFSLLAQRAVHRRLVSADEVRDMRNLVVRRCRQLDDLDQCLIDAERQQISLLAARLGETLEIAASSGHGMRVRNWSRKVEQAVAHLGRLEKNLAQTRDPEAVVVATLHLMRLYRAEPAAKSVAQPDAELRTLERKLKAGCKSPRYATKWRDAVVRHGGSCR